MMPMQGGDAAAATNPYLQAMQAMQAMNPQMMAMMMMNPMMNPQMMAMNPYMAASTAPTAQQQMPQPTVLINPQSVVFGQTPVSLGGQQPPPAQSTPQGEQAVRRDLSPRVAHRLLASPDNSVRVRRPSHREPILLPLASEAQLPRQRADGAPHHLSVCWPLSRPG
jgi:hypothetical protein